jgi:perosamine synthetase
MAPESATVAACRRAVAVWRDPRRCLAFAKGRVALYAILRALEIGEGDEVVVPGYTCVVVPAAILYTGAVPVYHDIDPTTLQGDPRLAAAAIAERTRAVLVQHNYGALAATADLLDRCRRRGIAVIEDCAHALGAHRGQAAAGTFGTAAFCSLQWSKPTTTGLGGIARFNDADLAAAARELFRTEFAEPARLRSISLGILASLYRAWYRPAWYWSAQGLYRWAGSRGLVQGSSSAAELAAAEMPPDYRERFGALRSRSLAAALDGLPALLAHRRRIQALYAARLAGGAAWLPPGDRPDECGAALRFPLLVENRPELLQRARRARIELGDWFQAPLHPQGARAEAFGYRDGCCPWAEAAAARVINLPTHRHVDGRAAGRILRFLATHARFTPAESWPAAAAAPPRGSPADRD